MDKFNKIEAYFENSLGESERQEFLKELESNPDLKSEFDFQQQIIEGIKEARKAELKAMLNNVPIASVGTSATAMYKVILGGAAALLVGSGIYWFYFSSNSQLEPNSQQPISEAIINTTPDKKDDTAGQTAEVIEDKETEIENQDVPTVQNSTSETTSGNNQDVVVNTPELPTENEDFTTTQTLPEENLEVPQNMGQATVNITSKVDVEIKMKKKYSFHYQFSAGKLVLYGDFEDEPFEVLEVNGADDSEVYLYYKSNYYYIKEKSGVITPLEEVNEEALYNKLEKLR